MALMNFRTENNPVKAGWSILSSPNFKLHVNRQKNTDVLYVSNELTTNRKKVLDQLFFEKLEFVKPLLNDLGINYYLLGNNDRQTGLMIQADLRPLKHKKIIFPFYGNFASPTDEERAEWTEKHIETDFKLKFLTDKLNHEKMLLEINYTETE